MKKIILATFFTVCMVFAVAGTVHAIDLGSGLAKQTAIRSGFDASTDSTTFSKTLGTVVKGALSFLGVIFMILMVYAGYLWMNARGDESKVDKAQSIIRAAIIGLIITVGAYSITNYIIPAVIERTANTTDSTATST